MIRPQTARWPQEAWRAAVLQAAQRAAVLSSTAATMRGKVGLEFET